MQRGWVNETLFIPPSGGALVIPIFFLSCSFCWSLAPDLRFSLGQTIFVANFCYTSWTRILNVRNIFCTPRGAKYIKALGAFLVKGIKQLTEEWYQIGLFCMHHSLRLSSQAEPTDPSHLVQTNWISWTDTKHSFVRFNLYALALTWMYYHPSLFSYQQRQWKHV